MSSFVLGIALVISVFTDIKKRKILNVVTFPTILFGIIYNAMTLGWQGLIFTGEGLLVGLGLLIFPYLLGGMGAGDVKLMGAIGSIMGATFVFYSFIYTALIGGIIALVLIIKKRGFWNSIRNFFFHITFFRRNLGSINFNKGHQPSSITFPYGVAIVLGTFCTLIWGGF
jgi:prepilin peptidase CpaA